MKLELYSRNIDTILTRIKDIFIGLILGIKWRLLTIRLAVGQTIIIVCDRLEKD